MSKGGSSGSPGSSGPSAPRAGVVAAVAASVLAAAPVVNALSPSSNSGAAKTAQTAHVSLRSAEGAHKGAKFTNVETSSMRGNAGLLADANKHFGEYDSKLSRTPTIVRAKPEMRNPADLMQPGRLPDRDNGQAKSAKEAANKLPDGALDPSLTPAQIGELMASRENLLKMMQKYGRVGPNGEHYFIMLAELNGPLGLGQQDMGAYSLGDGSSSSDA
jgi:hypothetical protein